MHSLMRLTSKYEIDEKTFHSELVTWPWVWPNDVIIGVTNRTKNHTELTKNDQVICDLFSFSLQSSVNGP